MNRLLLAFVFAGGLVVGIAIVALEMGILGTGYAEDQPLSDGQKAEMARIALGDPGVKAQLSGYNYTVGGEGYWVEESWYPVHVKKVYPSLQIMVPEQHRYYDVVIDLRRRAVLKILPDALPYVPPGPGHST